MRKILLPLFVLALATALSASAATITTYAGGGGTDADNIPATNSLLLGMEGLALDPAGNLFIAHFTGARIRRVDHATGLISTSAGLPGDYGFSGDNGPATAARVGTPMSVATDLSGNVYFLDYTANCVRKINHATGLITTVAGIPNSVDTTQVSGPATNAAFFILDSIAVDVHGNLYLADQSIVYRVDAASGLVHQVAGSVSAMGFSNDGIPATSALLGGPFGLAVDAADNLFFVDGQVPHTRVRRIDGRTGILTTVAGNGASDGASGSATDADLNGVSAFSTLAVDNLGGLYISGVGKVWKVNLNAGTISIFAGGTNGTGFSGDGGPATNALLSGIRGVASAGNGDVFLTDTANLRVRRISADTVPPYQVLVDLSAVTNFLTPQAEVQGRLGLATVNGHLCVVLPTDTDVTSGLFLTGTNGLKIFGVNGAGTLTFPALNTFGGNLTLVDNCGPTNIDLSSLTNLGGSLTISSNCSADIIVGSPSVGGNLTLMTSTTNSLNLSGAHVAGNTTVAVGGASQLTLATAGGSTSARLSNGGATVQAVLPAGTFTTNVTFSVTPAPTAALSTVGVLPAGGAASVTTVAAYQFNFAIPTLNQDATLTFEIQLSALAPTNRVALLAALNAGLATVAVIGNAPGSVWQTFPVCGGAQSPSAGGCVSVTRLDASGTPLPDGSPIEPTTLRFTGVAGHFSTWGVVIATPIRVTPTLLGNGTLRLAWPGPNAGVLETSTNLAPNSWSPVAGATQQPDGSWRLDVPSGEPLRFYRVKVL